MEKKFKRICPRCNEEVFHTNKGNAVSAEKLKRVCRKCLGDIQSIQFKGEGNPFYGSTHTKEAIEKISKNNKNRDMSEEERETKTKILLKYSNKDSIYNCWVKKYGEEIANSKLIAFKKLQSDNNKGSKNGMFGKISPNGTGNGWSGWYKGWYFRSILELSYLIFEIEENSLKWENAESKKLTINYVNYDGTERTYRADFLVEKKYLVECKPKRLINTPLVKLKEMAAIKFCEERNLVYKLVTPKRKLNFIELYELFKTKQIKFIDRYNTRFEEMINEKRRIGEIDR